MPPSTGVEHGRAAFDGGAWHDAYSALRAADDLDAEDLDRLAVAAYLVGDDGTTVQAFTRAHVSFLERGDTVRAARSALWLGFLTLDQPDQQAQAAGWLARAQRLVDACAEACVEKGWLDAATARQRVGVGDVAGAYEKFVQAGDIGVRFGDQDLVALARHGQGRTLLAMGRTAEGFTLIDEVMIAVTDGEIAPMIAGNVYCSVITACHDVFDLRRAQEWTAALDTWCASQPDVVPFRGRCLIHRAEILQLHGAWQEGLDEAQRACAQLRGTARERDAGHAFYQLAELHRLRGEYDDAEDAFRQASQAGRQPHPGLALLRLSQGRTEAADAAIRLALRDTRQPRARIAMLAAAVEIMLAAHDVAGARAAADELSRIGAGFDQAFPNAIASVADGAVKLAEGNALAALDALRSACAAWRELDVPYEIGRARVLIGLAYRQLGDHEGAQLEFEAAHECFEALHATVDAARAAALARHTPAPTTTALTGREIEVLRLIATGDTNRGIATRLGISEKTVARHISNIYTKLDLPSRAAATAYAYTHKLL